MSQAAADALVAEGDEWFRAEEFSEALVRYERAAQIFPTHALAWRGVGSALLRMARPHDAARAFDRAIGLRTDSATALWGGAIAHADVGNRVMAQNYLRRALALQPSWIEMARGVPNLAVFLQVSTRAADLIRSALGAYAARTYRHAADAARGIEIGRLVGSPDVDQFTFVTIGLANTAWPDASMPRVELVMATSVDDEVCGQILANLAFHLTDTGFFPEAGTMVRDVIGALGVPNLSSRLPHVYLAKPRAWGVHLPLDVGPPPITLAQVVPVSEAEYQTWRRGVAGLG
jgi:tetratricopeptide (TPR) repeat protein